MNTLIFYRLATAKEQKSQSDKNKAFKAIPAKDGYNKVYMPYGFKGKGFYYSKIVSKG